MEAGWKGLWKASCGISSYTAFTPRLGSYTDPCLSYSVGMLVPWPFISLALTMYLARLQIYLVTVNSSAHQWILVWLWLLLSFSRCSLTGRSLPVLCSPLAPEFPFLVKPSPSCCSLDNKRARGIMKTSPFHLIYSFILPMNIKDVWKVEIVSHTLLTLVSLVFSPFPWSIRVFLCSHSRNFIHFRKPQCT